MNLILLIIDKLLELITVNSDNLTMIGERRILDIARLMENLFHKNKNKFSHLFPERKICSYKYTIIR